MLEAIDTRKEIMKAIASIRELPTLGETLTEDDLKARRESDDDPATKGLVSLGDVMEHWDAGHAPKAE